LPKATPYTFGLIGDWFWLASTEMVTAAFCAITGDAKARNAVAVTIIVAGSRGQTPGLLSRRPASTVDCFTPMFISPH
jgi:hypothetical protein